jgi:CheY-like chemotaxis protein
MPHRHPTILLIDDHDDIREGLTELFRAEGYTVIATHNGRDALTKLHSGAHPCIILMDLMMPVMTGFEFRREQLARPDFKDIPVVIYSGVHDLAEVAKDLHAKAYVEKPILLDRLMAIIREHCLK